MKYKMIAIVLALTVMSWAQTATQTGPAAPQTTPAEKAKCACCDKMAAGAKACGAHHDMAAGEMKDMGSCCGGKEAKSGDGKDAMSCMRNDKDKAAASCCKDGCKDKAAGSCCGEKCGKDCEKGCCSSEKKTEKPA